MVQVSSDITAAVVETCTMCLNCRSSITRLHAEQITKMLGLCQCKHFEYAYAHDQGGSPPTGPVYMSVLTTLSKAIRYLMPFRNIILRCVTRR